MPMEFPVTIWVRAMFLCINSRPMVRLEHGQLTFTRSNDTALWDTDPVVSDSGGSNGSLLCLIFHSTVVQMRK